MKKYIFCILKVTEDFGTDPHPDPFFSGMDPRICILNCTKMSRIRNNASLISFVFDHFLAARHL
jgi:hypothetical protein